MDIKILASGSRGNCYYVSDGITPLLLECGIPIGKIELGLGFGLWQIRGCLVSHEHLDHSKSMQVLARRGIDVYASLGTFVALKTDLSAHTYRLNKVDPLYVVNLGSWHVTPFLTKHDAAEPLGFLLASDIGQRLLYLTDTAYTVFRFPPCSHIMVECNYDKELLAKSVDTGEINRAVKHRVIHSHMSLETVKGMLLANDLSQVQEIWLLHLSDSHSDAEAFRREIQELTGKIVKVA